MTLLSMKFTLENCSINLQKEKQKPTKISHNVLSKITSSSWATFIASPGCIWPSHGLDINQ